MALTRYTPANNVDDTPVAADAGMPTEAVAREVASNTPTAGIKEKSKDTYVKIKLSTDKATPDTWFKLSETKPDGIKVFRNDKKELSMMIHPDRSALMLYGNKDAVNYFEADSKRRNIGLVGRFYASSTRPTAEKPETRIYLSGKYHAAGLVDAVGALKGDALKVFGGIVGLEADELMANLKLKADSDREKADAYKSNNITSSTPGVKAPTPPSMPRPGDDLEFGM